MKPHPGPIAAILTPLLTLTMAASSPYPDSIPLPDDFAPEGIAVGTGSTFYVSSLADGDIYRGDLRTGTGAVFIEGDAGAAGLKVDERRHLLVVAAGFTGQGIFYDSRDGSTVDRVQLGAADGSSLINDVVLTRDAAYFTDSFKPNIYKVPIAADGTLGAADTISVTGPAEPIMGDPLTEMHGIEATPDGKTLLVVNSGLGGAFTVDPVSGASSEITIPGGPLPGSLDGILLDDKTLWMVANFANTVLGVRLSPDLSSGQVVDTITNDDVDGLLRVPTTVAEHGNKLVLVNGRFDQGFPPPFGEGAPPGTDYDVVQIDKP